MIPFVLLMLNPSVFRISSTNALFLGMTRCSSHFSMPSPVKVRSSGNTSLLSLFTESIFALMPSNPRSEREKVRSSSSYNRRLYRSPTASGSSISSTRTSFPRTPATLRSISRERFCAPLSILQIFDRFVPIRSASCCWVIPFSKRAAVSSDMIRCLSRSTRSSSMGYPSSFTASCYHI